MTKTKPNNKQKKQDETAAGPTRPLLRSRENRVIWGVAGGLADHTGFSATLVRVAFVAITLFGGAGILAYLVLAVALPEDDGTGKPVAESVWSRLGRVTLVCVLVAVGLSLAIGLAAASAWAVAVGQGTIVAIAVIVLGAAIIAIAFAGESRRRLAAWVLTGALVLAVPAGAVAAADIKIDGSVGQRTYTPTVASDIPDSGYELGTGQLVVDLRDLPWRPGQTIHASADLGIGQMIVSVPSNVCIVGHATGKAGELIVGGQVSDGWDPDVDQGTPRSDAPRLDLDADIQFGQLIVTDEDPDAIDDQGADYDHHSAEEEAQQRVCGR